MSWLLDADVLSQPAKRNGDARVISWLHREQDRCYTSAIVIGQLAYWVRTKQGGQREALQEWLTRLIEAMQGRIRGFNVSVANVWADLQHQLDEAGQRMPIEDSYIAATALRHGLTVVTGNDRHFRRLTLKIFNPVKSKIFPKHEMHASRRHASSGEPARAAHGWKMCHERRQRQQLDRVQIDAAPAVEIDTEAPAAYIRVSQNPVLHRSITR